ncbi:MAG: T9SS sorting signal type C domain-containing protein, partial [Pedobacter sp.]
GNPYPSAIDADLFLDPAGVNDGKVGGTIYFWTHYTPINASGQYIASDFAVYNFVGGVGTGTAAAGSSITPNGFIASGQGFFVNALPSNPNGSVNATMNNSMRVSGQNNQFFRSASDTNDKNRIWLDLKNEAGAFKQTLVGYLNNATNDRDIYYDSDVIEAGNPVSLYSVAVTDKFAIQGRAIPFDVNDEVPLGFRAESQGAFEIVLSNFDGLFGEQDIYLEDTYLNVIHDLKQSTYSFTTTAGTFEDRFILRYTTEALGTTEATLGDNSVVVYKSQPATINISTGTTNMKKVAIYDLRGRLLIWKDNIEASQTSFPQLPFANQVLMVQVTDADGKVVTKKISF